MITQWWPGDELKAENARLRAALVAVTEQRDRAVQDTRRMNFIESMMSPTSPSFRHTIDGAIARFDSAATE